MDDVVQRPNRAKSALLTGLLLIVAFGVGYIPKELEVRRTTTALRESERALRLATLHRQLGVAAHEAGRNNYPAASSAANSFFEGCREAVAEVDLADRPRTRLALSAYAAAGPRMLMQINAGDPAVSDRLSQLYLTMHGLLERRQ